VRAGGAGVLLSGSFTPAERSLFLHQFKGLWGIQCAAGDQRGELLRRVF
jgi:hypothetical protein